VAACGDPGCSGERNNPGIAAGRLSTHFVQPGDYSKTNASGLHHVEFDNLLWRDRGSGQGFRASGSHYYSEPQVMDIVNRPSTLYPVFAWGHANCEQSEFIATGAPLLEGPSQHPTQCRRKAPSVAPFP
jgi:hypothetical protein